MSTVEEIEEAVSRLTRDKLAKFRAWFEEFDAAQFDRQIEHDADEGRLNGLADQALADFHQGRTREL
jgi:hypothetical protein